MSVQDNNNNPLEGLKQGLNQGKQRSFGGATPLTTTGKQLEGQTKAMLILNFLSIPIDLIDNYVPNINNLLPRGIFNTLFVICYRPTLSIHAIHKLTGSDRRSLMRYTNYLLELGYIREVCSPTYIPLFDSYKVNRGFEGTTKGMQVVDILINWDERSDQAKHVRLRSGGNYKSTG